MSAISPQSSVELQSIFPWYLRWLSILDYLLFASIVTVLSVCLAVLIASFFYGKTKNGPWTEQARFARTSYRASGFAAAMTAIGLSLNVSALWGCISPISERTLIVVGVVTVIVVGESAWFFIRRRLFFPRLTVADGVRDSIVSYLLFLPGFLVIGIVCAVIPARINGTAVAIFGVGFAIYCIFMTGGGSLLTLVLGLARPASVRLMNIVSRASQLVGVYPKRVYELAWCRSNAIAYPIFQHVFFTDDLLATLNDEDLVTVAVHELAHLSESRGVKVARFLHPLVFYPFAALIPAMGEFGAMGGLAVIIFVMLSIRVIGKIGLARKMEIRADSAASGHPEIASQYANALAKIYQRNLAPAVMGAKRGAHPDLYDRLIASGVTPTFPRPKPPSRAAILASYALILLFVSPMGVGPKILFTILARRGWNDATSMERLATLDGGQPRTIWRLASLLENKNQAEKELASWHLLAEFCSRPGSRYESWLVDALSGFARQLAKMNNLQEAEQVYRDALNLSEKEWGVDSVKTGWQLYGLACVIWKNPSRRNEAEAIARQILKRCQDQADDDDEEARKLCAYAKSFLPN